MARKTRHSVTSLGLIPVLVLQTACVTALGPPMPINPGDQVQREAIERADRVKVVMVGGTEYRLARATLAADQLGGFAAGRRTMIRLDLISTVQAYDINEGLAALGFRCGRHRCCGVDRCPHL